MLVFVATFMNGGWLFRSCFVLAMASAFVPAWFAFAFMSEPIGELLLGGKSPGKVAVAN